MANRRIPRKLMLRIFCRFESEKYSIFLFSVDVLYSFDQIHLRTLKIVSTAAFGDFIGIDRFFFAVVDTNGLSEFVIIVVVLFFVMPIINGECWNECTHLAEEDIPLPCLTPHDISNTQVSPPTTLTQLFEIHTYSVAHSYQFILSQACRKSIKSWCNGSSTSTFSSSTVAP